MDYMARHRKRREKEQRELMQKGLKLDYSKLPDDVKEAIEPIPYVVEENVKLTWDGRQYILRIPKEIAEEAGITAENRISFKLVKPSPESAEKPKLEITVL
ncbi:MAG: hypothetical protein ACYCO0_02640 [Candidatus Micrarchaeaceae archaeon]